MVLHPTTESKSKLENCGVGVQRSMGTKKVEGPWHGHHGQLLKENYDPLKFEDFWGLGSNSWCAPHTPSSVPPSISVTGRDTFNMWWGGSQGLRRRSQLHQKLLFTIVWSAIVAKYLWSQLCSEGQQGHNRAGCKGLRRLRPSWDQLASYLIEVDVLRMLRYCRMSGTVIKRKARKKRRPVYNDIYLKEPQKIDPPIQVRSRYMDTKDGGMVK